MSPQQDTAATAIYSLMSPPPRLQSPIRLDARMRASARRPSSRCRPPRPRHSKRAEFHVESTLHPFDRLPWISAMDVTPDALDLTDIADLSQLAVDDDCSAVSAASGPIRRRKTSLRSSPLAPKSVPIIHDTTPHTPLSHVDISRVHFHNLMPVISCDHNARP